MSPSDGASTWVIVEDDFELHDGGCACRRRRRSTKSADAVLRTVCEFVRFGARHELVDATLVDRLFETRFLKFLPAGFEPDEDGQQRTVRSRLLRFAVAEEPFSFIEPERVDDLVAAAGNVRDRFLVALVAMTGRRIGEALGPHRADMHFPSDSRTLRCKVVGPHLHVRRRPDNPNGALAESRFSRSVTVASVGRRAKVSTWLVYTPELKAAVAAAQARRADEPAHAPPAAAVATDLALARAEIARLRAERDRQSHQLRLALGARVDQLNKADLAERVDEMTRHDRQLSAELAQAQGDARKLQARVTELEDDLTAARTSFRRMIRAENLPAPVTTTNAASPTNAGSR